MGYEETDQVPEELATHPVTPFLPETTVWLDPPYIKFLAASIQLDSSSNAIENAGAQRSQLEKED